MNNTAPQKKLKVVIWSADYAFYRYNFGVAKPESDLRIGPSRRGSALTSKTAKIGGYVEDWT